MPKKKGYKLEIYQESNLDQKTLEKKIYELAMAYRVYTEIGKLPDPKERLDVLIDKVAALLAVEIVSLMLLDEKRRNLSIKASKGLEPAIVKKAKAKVGEGIAGWVAKTGEPLLIRDLSKDSRFAGRGTRRYTTQSLLSVPIKVYDRVIGVLNVNNKKTKKVFTEKDLRVLSAVADLAAAFIEHGRFQNFIKWRNELRVKSLHTIIHDLSNPLSGIKGAVYMMLGGTVGKINDNQKKLMELAKRNTDRLAVLIRELLDPEKLK